MSKLEQSKDFSGLEVKHLKKKTLKTSFLCIRRFFCPNLEQLGTSSKSGFHQVFTHTAANSILDNLLQISEYIFEFSLVE